MSVLPARRFVATAAAFAGPVAPKLWMSAERVRALSGLAASAVSALFAQLFAS